MDTKDEDDSGGEMGEQGGGGASEGGEDAEHSKPQDRKLQAAEAFQGCLSVQLRCRTGCHSMEKVVRESKADTFLCLTL